MRRVRPAADFDMVGHAILACRWTWH